MTSYGDGCAAELACVPAAITPEERVMHFALIRRLFGDLVQERAESPGGYAYRFAAAALDPVARFIANERKCCPFLDFELEIAAGSGLLWLRMSGPDGTRAILDAELGLASPALSRPNS